MIRKQTYEPAAMSEDARAALVAELLPLNEAIFEGVAAATFARYLLAPTARRTRIQVIRDAGRPVGYCTIQTYDYADSPGRPLVMRGVMGLRREYRRKTAFGWFVAGEVAAVRLMSLGRPLYGFACPVHPGSYRFFANYGVDVWPQSTKSTPPEIQGLLERLRDEFDLEERPGQPGVCYVGWTTIEGRDETAAWARDPDEATRFYVSRNPFYRDGYGLLVVVPVRLSRIVQGVLRLAVKRARMARPRLTRAEAA